MLACEGTTVQQRGAATRARAWMDLVDVEPTTLFPYDAYRKEQREFILQSHELLEAGTHVIVSAPNGFGKTVSVLSAVLPVAMRNDLKVVYCCRTHTQNSRVIAELDTIHRRLQARGEKDVEDALAVLGGVSLRGRGDACLKEQIRDSGLSPGDAASVCTQLRSDGKCIYYKNLQKIAGKMEEFLASNAISTVAFDADFIMDTCAVKKLCPYLFGRELLKSVRVSVVNYNWFFNPVIQERFLEALGVPVEEVLLIVDEAHNLPSLAEEIHSLKLGRNTIAAARRELTDYYRSSKADVARVRDLVDAVEALFDKHERKCKGEEIELDARGIFDDLDTRLGGNALDALRLATEKGEEIQKFKVEAGRKNPRSFLKGIAHFWREWHYTTQDRAAYYHCFSTDQGKLAANHHFEAVCLDPGLVGMQDLLERVYASISLSGTIVPEAYSAICRIPRNQHVFALGTPFSETQVKAVVLEGVSTGLQARSSHMYETYVAKIAEMAKATPKNSAVFCASYGVLKGIVDAGFDKAVRSAGKMPLKESPGMTSAENDELIAQYKEYARVSDGSVLLGVCGGRNSEGEDFPGDEMNAVMIAGIPYATPTQRVKKKIEYYDTIFHGNKGWLLGYEIPAIQRANQACGRPIRTTSDRGAIILADERFMRQKIMVLLSPWITRSIVALRDAPGALHASLTHFFGP